MIMLVAITFMADCLAISRTSTRAMVKCSCGHKPTNAKHFDKI